MKKAIILLIVCLMTILSFGQDSFSRFVIVDGDTARFNNYNQLSEFMDSISSTTWYEIDFPWQNDTVCPSLFYDYDWSNPPDFLDSTLIDTTSISGDILFDSTFISLDGGTLILSMDILNADSLRPDDNDTIPVIIMYCDTTIITNENNNFFVNGHQIKSQYYDKQLYWSKAYLVEDHVFWSTKFLTEDKKEIPESWIIWNYKY